jgi:hypothetical protein
MLDSMNMKEVAIESRVCNSRIIWSNEYIDNEKHKNNFERSII